MWAAFCLVMVRWLVAVVHLWVVVMARWLALAVVVHLEIVAKARWLALAVHWLVVMILDRKDVQALGSPGAEGLVQHPPGANLLPAKLG